MQRRKVTYKLHPSAGQAQKLLDGVRAAVEVAA
jgi:hypothetical protein